MSAPKSVWVIAKPDGTAGDTAFHSFDEAEERRTRLHAAWKDSGWGASVVVRYDFALEELS